MDAIIIGAGPSGIAMAHSLKHKLNINNFTVRAQSCFANFYILFAFLTSILRYTRSSMDLEALGEKILILDGISSYLHVLDFD